MVLAFGLAHTIFESLSITTIPIGSLLKAVSPAFFTLYVIEFHISKRFSKLLVFIVYRELIMPDINKASEIMNTTIGMYNSLLSN